MIFISTNRLSSQSKHNILKLNEIYMKVVKIRML